MYFARYKSSGIDLKAIHPQDLTGSDNSHNYYELRDGFSYYHGRNYSGQAKYKVRK